MHKYMYINWELQSQEIDSKTPQDLKCQLWCFGTWMFQIPLLEKKKKKKALNTPSINEYLQKPMCFS